MTKYAAHETKTDVHFTVKDFKYGSTVQWKRERARVFCRHHEWGGCSATRRPFVAGTARSVSAFVAVPSRNGGAGVSRPNAIRRGFSNTFEVKKFRCLRLLLLPRLCEPTEGIPATGPSTARERQCDGRPPRRTR